MIEIDNVTKKFGRFTAIEDLSVTVEERRAPSTASSATTAPEKPPF